MLPGMEAFPHKPEPGYEDATQYARLDEEVVKTAGPLTKAPQFAVLLQHDAEIAHRILQEKESIEY